MAGAGSPSPPSASRPSSMPCIAPPPCSSDFFDAVVTQPSATLRNHENG